MHAPAIAIGCVCARAPEQTVCSRARAVTAPPRNLKLFAHRHLHAIAPQRIRACAYTRTRSAIVSVWVRSAVLDTIICHQQSDLLES